MSASAPDAPPLSETTIGCFIRLFFCTAACIMRAIWSDAPPAPAATTISTGLVGSHAAAGAAVRISAKAAAPQRLLDVTSMCVLSLGFAGLDGPPWRQPPLRSERIIGRIYASVQVQFGR